MPTPPVYKKLTPVLSVVEIEPCLSFWTDRLGFETVFTVPHGDHLGFAMLAKDGIEVMYQSHASLRADLKQSQPAGPAILYIEVANLDDLLDRLDPATITVPRRRTFYGADEVFVLEPGGNTIGFAVQSHQ